MSKLDEVRFNLPIAMLNIRKSASIQYRNFFDRFRKRDCVKFAIFWLCRASYLYFIGISYNNVKVFVNLRRVISRIRIVVDNIGDLFA